MTPPVLEVADVVRAHGRAFLDAFGPVTAAEQRRVLRDLTRCRTAALGGHVEACDRCGRRQIAYNSCRNRHCPKCQGAARARWLNDRAAELLPVEYFHVVFTLPCPIGPVALQNPGRVTVWGDCRRSVGPGEGVNPAVSRSATRRTGVPNRRRSRESRRKTRGPWPG